MGYLVDQIKRNKLNSQTTLKRQEKKDLLSPLTVRLSPFVMAERVGFEPTEPFRAQRLSRPPDSTTLAPLRLCELFILKVAIAVIKLRRFSPLAASPHRGVFNVAP